MDWYQQLPQIIDPIVFGFAGVEIRWYSLAWVAAVALMWGLLSWRVRKGEGRKWDIDNDLVDDIVLWGLVGGLIGARLGYGLIYDFAQTIVNPLSLVMPLGATGEWIGIGGMSFHGGLIGVVVAWWLVSRKYSIQPFVLSDWVVPVLPVISLIGRIGNFLNHELYGRITQMPWGMNFAHSSDVVGVLRHPSQLYQSVLEGGVLLAVLWWLRNRFGDRRGLLTAIYLIGYGVARFVVEFWRMPDVGIGFVFVGFTMGQVLSALMVMGGGVLLANCAKSKKIKIGRFW